MKAKTTATLCLKASGEIIGEIANEYDTRSVSARHSGAMTDDELRKCLKLIEKVCLGGPQPISIELIGKLLSLNISPFLLFHLLIFSFYHGMILRTCGVLTV